VPRDELPPSRPQELGALWGTYESFFRLNPIRLKSREMVDSLALGPATLRKYSRLSERVAAGSSSTSTAESRLLAHSPAFGGLYPGSSSEAASPLGVRSWRSA
jgi:hypothetical protein